LVLGGTTPARLGSVEQHTPEERGSMAEYRGYTVGDDGHFSGFEPFVCGDDAEAIELARRHF